MAPNTHLSIYPIRLKLPKNSMKSKTLTHLALHATMDFMRATAFAAHLLALSFLFSTNAQGRDLEGRIGVGASYQDFNSLTAVSVRYHMAKYLSTTFIAGFDSQNSVRATILGLKVLRMAHMEDNLNFYVGAGAALVSDTGGTASVSSGFQLDGLVGAEFFVSGLYNLGFQFEAGVALRTTRNVTFATTGTLGIHYYF